MQLTKATLCDQQLLWLPLRPLLSWEARLSINHLPLITGPDCQGATPVRGQTE